MQFSAGAAQGRPDQTSPTMDFSQHGKSGMIYLFKFFSFFPQVKQQQVCFWASTSQSLVAITDTKFMWGCLVTLKCKYCICPKDCTVFNQKLQILYKHKIQGNLLIIQQNKGNNAAHKFKTLYILNRNCWQHSTYHRICKKGGKYDSLAIDKSNTWNLWSKPKKQWRKSAKIKENSIQINPSKIQTQAIATDQNIPLYINILPWGLINISY